MMAAPMETMMPQGLVPSGAGLGVCQVRGVPVRMGIDPYDLRCEQCTRRSLLMATKR